MYNLVISYNSTGDYIWDQKVKLNSFISTLISITVFNCPYLTSRSKVVKDFVTTSNKNHDNGGQKIVRKLRDVIYKRS
jgi:hypothetical protein